jgi:acyl-CoA thioesterase 8
MGGRESNPNSEIKFIVSLDHTMYFHDLTDVRADDWVLMESETTWADCSRALVVQRMYTSNGKLIATCIQEGLARMSGPARRDKPDSKI